MSTPHTDHDALLEHHALAEQASQRHGSSHLIANLALSIMGFAIALVVVELLLRANPSLVPAEVRTYPPVRRVDRMADRTWLFRLSDGDLFYWLAGDIALISEGEDRLLAEIHYITDERGFRNPPPVQDQYDVVALGDSVTEAPVAPTPWPAALSARTGLGVYNLGVSAFGPQEEVNLLEEFGRDMHPRWIMLAYFEGNDLNDAAAYEQAQPFLLPRVAKHFFTSVLTARADATSDAPEGQVPPSNCRYPVSVTTGGRTLSLAFFPGYISWLTASAEDIEASRNFQLLRTSLLRARERSQALGACFVLVYVPSKPRIYLPHIDDPEPLQRIFRDLSAVKLADSGFLEFSDDPATAELALRHMNMQAKALGALARETHIPLIDLTPHFQAATADGAQLYYAFDTHWNQEGHDLAAKIIAQYLADADWVACSP